MTGISKLHPELVLSRTCCEHIMRKDAPKPQIIIDALEGILKSGPVNSESMRLKMPCSWVDGVPHPHFVKETAVRRTAADVSFRSGDVVLVMNFPSAGFCRLVRALLSDLDPWMPNLAAPENWFEAAASACGPESYMESLHSQVGRRVFETKLMPSIFPTERLIEASQRESGVSPKIAVIVPDPRFTIAFMHEAFELIHGHAPCLKTLIEVEARGYFRMWGDAIDFGKAWAKEAARHPETVKLFCGDSFASWDPREVKAALEGLASFLEIPESESACERVMSSIYNNPWPEGDKIVVDDRHSPMTYPFGYVSGDCNGGSLLGLLGPRLKLFEETLSEMAGDVRSSWNASMSRWCSSSDPLLSRLGMRAVSAEASLPPVARLLPMRGEEAHRNGTCRPCVFALRGRCQNSPEMCAFCHEEGHPQPKRASQKKRQAQRRSRVRTPSPEPLALHFPQRTALCA